MTTAPPHDDPLSTLLPKKLTSKSSPNGPTPTDDDEHDQALPFPTVRIGDLARAVDAAPAPRFVVRRLLVEADYGVLAAMHKWGKGWFVIDAAVNVTAGGSVLGAFPVDMSGPALLFAGEGGRRKIVRRVRAVANHYGHGLELPLHIYERAPKLGSLEQVARLRATVEQVTPVLVIVDPAYLALAGAETSNLVAMGVLLERIQIVCQDAGAALVMSHHWNKTGNGTTADRFTGSGFAEWGRVLMSGATLSRNTDPDTQATTAVCKLEVTGDEIADTDVTFRRRVWVDDPDDLTSAMHYEVDVLTDVPLPETDDTPGLKPAARRVLAVLRDAGAHWLDHVDIGDKLAEGGHPLTKRTILEAGQALEAVGLIESHDPGGGLRKVFRAHLTAGNAP